MASVFRGPLYISRREFPPVLAVTAFAVANLLVTTLAPVVPPPLVATNSLPLQVHPKLGPNANTSQGTPLTLLTPVAALPPPGKATFPSGTRLLPWQPSDTSQSAYATLRPVVIIPLPPGSFSSAVPVRFWFQPNDTSQPTDPNLFPPDITPPPTPPAGGGSNAGAGVGGSGGGKWLRKYVDELEYLVEIEKRLKKGKTLKEAIAELKKDPEIAKEVSRIEKKALARKPEAIRWIAEQLRSREPRDIIAPSPDYLDEAIEFMEADEEIVMVAVAIAALRKRSS